MILCVCYDDGTLFAGGASVQRGGADWQVVALLKKLFPYLPGSRAQKDVSPERSIK